MATAILSHEKNAESRICLQSFLVLLGCLLMTSSGFVTATSPGAATAGADYGQGYWSTNGSKIIDSQGRQVLFSGVNWLGFEDFNFAPHGLWRGANSYIYYLDLMKELGFNLIRLGFCGEMFKDPKQMPKSIDYRLNPDLAGLTVMGVMDKIVQGAGKRGIRIILDYHRINAGEKPEWGLWYDAKSPEDFWIKNWVFLATRYAGNPTVVGADLFNEVHDSTQFDGPYWAAKGMYPGFNWRDAVTKAGNAIHEVNPDLLICVQGMHGNSWWGGNCQAYGDLPLVLKVPNKVVYSIHDYGPVVYLQEWHKAADFPKNMPAYWSKMWAYLVEEDIAPVWVGEWGSAMRVNNEYWPIEEKWLYAFRDFIKEMNLPWTWFGWTPNSYDTEGILLSNYTTPDPRKLKVIESVMHPNFSPSSDLPDCTHNSTNSGVAVLAVIDPRCRRLLPPPSSIPLASQSPPPPPPASSAPRPSPIPRRIALALSTLLLAIL